MNILFAIRSIIIASALSAVAVAKPLPVSIGQLIADPRRWNDKEISVTGYYSIDAAEHGSHLSAKVKTDGDGQAVVFINLPPNITNKKARQAANHWIRVTGTFQYRELRQRTIKETKDNPEVAGIVEITRGFGWMGIFDKQITNISNIEVVSKK